MTVIADYPVFSEISMEMRPDLHVRFKALAEGISEFTFANIYLFRGAHNYRISRLDGELFVITGRDAEPFFMLPFGLPDKGAMKSLFAGYGSMKCASESQGLLLAKMGYSVDEDRDNFDYLYRREDLAGLSGRKLHRKKNLVNFFVRNNSCQAKPLLDEYLGDAMRILESWRKAQTQPGDYAAAGEALEKTEELQLCGGIFYVDAEPVAYCLGEELALGTTYAIHFEKAVIRDNYKGVYQFINQSFAAVLPEKYEMINREQDLGDIGLRQAKESYRPAGFVKKLRVTA